MGQDLSIVGRALSDLSDLDQHIKCLCEVRKQPRGDTKKQSSRRGESGSLEDNCDKTCVELEFLGDN